MIAYLKGNIIKKEQDKVIIIVNNIGYEVRMGLKDINHLDKKKEQEIYIYNYYKQDRNELYGFSSYEKRKYFQLLLSVQGLGPKTAINIIGNLEKADIEKAVMENNYLILNQIPGIGKKTAINILKKLREKIRIEELEEVPQIGEDIINALKSMGFDYSQAKQAAIEALKSNKTDLEDLVKIAIKYCSDIKF